MQYLSRAFAGVETKIMSRAKPIRIGKNLNRAINPQLKRIGILTLGLLSLTVVMAGQAQAASPTYSKYDWGEPEFKAKPRHSIQFPREKALGGLAISDKPIFQHGEAKTKNLLAQGQIDIPAGKFVIFFPNHVFFHNPQLIESLKPDSIDSVVLRYATMDDGEEGYSVKAMPSLAKLTDIKVMDLEKSEMNDAGLSELKPLKNLQALLLFANEFDGSFLKELTGLNKLKVLILNNNDVKVENLRYLSRYKSIKVLGLSYTHLTAASAGFLADMPQLETLLLAGNYQLDDKVIPILAKLKNLHFLDIRKTGITMNGFKRLKVLLPKTMVHSYLDNTSPNAKPKNSEVETIFAPLSRGRKL